jgi:hypothetical protein
MKCECVKAYKQVDNEENRNNTKSGVNQNENKTMCFFNTSLESRTTTLLHERYANLQGGMIFV